jgi:hypothetical protein
MLRKDVEGYGSDGEQDGQRTRARVEATREEVESKRDDATISMVGKQLEISGVYKYPHTRSGRRLVRFGAKVARKCGERVSWERFRKEGELA